MATESEILAKLNDMLARYDTALSVDGGSKLLTLSRTAAGDTAAVVIQQGGAERWRMGQFGADAFELQRSPTGALLDYTAAISVNRSTGAVTISGAVLVGLGTAGAPGLAIAGDTDTGLYSPGANQIALVAGGTARVTATTSGATVTGGLTSTGLGQFGFSAIIGNFPGQDFEDADAGNTTHNRFRQWRDGSALRWGTMSAGAASLVSTDLFLGITASGVDSWSWRLLGTQKMALNNFGLTVPDIYTNTTADAVNVVIGAGGTLRRSTSSLKYKADVEPADRALLRDTLMGIAPIWYRSSCASDDPDLSWWGIGAEDLAALDPRFVAWRTVEEAEETYVERWPVFGTDPETGEAAVTWHEEERTRPVLVPLPREDWTAEGVAYDRLTVALIAVVQDQQAALADLTARVAALEAA